MIELVERNSHMWNQDGAHGTVDFEVVSLTLRGI